MKKILLLLLTCTMLLSLIACNGEQPHAVDPSNGEQNGNGGDNDALNAKDLFSLSPDIGATAASLTYTFEYPDGNVVIKRTFDGDNFSEERDEGSYDYIDGWYYQSTTESTFRAEIPREDVVLYYGAELPSIPDLTVLTDEQLANVPVEEVDNFYSFTVHLTVPFLHEEIKKIQGYEIEATEASFHFDKSYRLMKIVCKHTLASQSGYVYTVKATISADAFADEVTLKANAVMQSYRKLLKEDAASFVASLPHPGDEGDYRIFISTQAERETGASVINQKIEIVQSGNNYLYHFSAIPHSPSTYLRYYFSDSMVYQIYYDANDKRAPYKKVCFPMAQAEFEEALDLNVVPEPGDDFTDVFSVNFSDTLKGIAAYEDTNGDIAFSYTTDPTSLLDGQEFEGWMEEAKVVVLYEKDADKLTISITFPATLRAQSGAYTYKAFYSIETVFEGFTNNVELTLPDPAEFTPLTD